jgi:hypothetical protein
MVAPAHVPLRRRSFSLRDSHCGTFEIFGTTIKIATICASSRQGSFWGLPAGGGRIVANRGSYSRCGGERKRSVVWIGVGSKRRFRTKADMGDNRLTPEQRSSGTGFNAIQDKD